MYGRTAHTRKNRAALTWVQVRYPSRAKRRRGGRSLLFQIGAGVHNGLFYSMSTVGSSIGGWPDCCSMPLTSSGVCRYVFPGTTVVVLCCERERRLAKYTIAPTGSISRSVTAPVPYRIKAEYAVIQPTLKFSRTPVAKTVAPTEAKPRISSRIHKTFLLILRRQQSTRQIQRNRVRLHSAAARTTVIRWHPPYFLVSR